VTEGADALTHEPLPNDAAAAGALLRAGREAAGLSVAAVAQQLKLAPRQIAALEDGDFTKLPGRTFVRGFMRNYARLLRLDSDAVLAALPESAAAPSLEHPSLAPTPRPMGELPAEVHAKPNPARWAIPLALVAVVTVAAVYEISRPPAETAKAVVNDKAVETAPPMAAISEAAPAAAPPNAATTALPNPLATLDNTAGAARDNAAGKMESGEAAATTPPESASAPMALAFRGKSWVEVRDATGVLVVQVTGSAGATQAVSGRAPFDVILGNAAVVNVTWQGKPFDTTPYTHQNVARFTLR
jgi:cytoskeleton protein RodZ